MGLYTSRLPAAGATCRPTAMPPPASCGLEGQVRAVWSGVTVKLVGGPPAQLDFNDAIPIEVELDLHGLGPNDVRVECVVSRELCSDLTVSVKQFAGRGSHDYGVRTIEDQHVFVQDFVPVEAGGGTETGRSRYRIELRPPWCGSLNYRVRVVPWHAQLAHPYEMGLMSWLSPEAPPQPAA